MDVFGIFFTVLTYRVYSPKCENNRFRTTPHIKQKVGFKKKNMECMRDLQHLAEDPRLSTRVSIGDYSILEGRDSLVNERNQMLSWYAPAAG